MIPGRHVLLRTILQAYLLDTRFYVNGNLPGLSMGCPTPITLCGARDSGDRPPGLLGTLGNSPVRSELSMPGVSEVDMGSHEVTSPDVLPNGRKMQ